MSFDLQQKTENYIELETIDNLRLMPNNVLIRIDSRNDIVRMKNGVELVLNTSYAEGEHKPCWGTIVKCCDKLNTPAKDASGRRMNKFAVTTNRRWEPEFIQLKPNDIVFFSFLAGNNAERILCNNQEYYFLDYNELILFVRDGETEMLNGYMLLFPIEKDDMERGIQRPFKENEERMYTVVDVGKSNKRYYEYDNMTRRPMYSDVEVKRGCVVYVKYPVLPKLEYDTHRTYGDVEQDYYVCQKKDILGICTQ
jgi:hypothetical protein